MKPRYHQKTLEEGIAEAEAEVKCVTFDKDAQDKLPQYLTDKMKADREQARKSNQ